MVIEEIIHLSVCYFKMHGMQCIPHPYATFVCFVSLFVCLFACSLVHFVIPSERCLRVLAAQKCQTTLPKRVALVLFEDKP